MHSPESLVQKIVDTLEINSPVKAYGEISVKAGISKTVVKRTLRLGQDKLFIRAEDGWQINGPLSKQRIENFINENNSQLRVFIGDWEAAIKNKKNGNNRNGITFLKSRAHMLQSEDKNPSSDKDYNRESSRTWGDGLTKGRTKSYNGPQGMYWTDPSFKKKEF